MIEQIEIVKSRDGFNILNIKNTNKVFNVGSKYNEKREIDKLISKIPKINEYNNYIIFGLGCGNHVIELLNRKCLESKVLIIECFDECVEKVKKSELDSIKYILDNPDVEITSCIEDVSRFLKNNINHLNIDNLIVLTYGGYETHFLDEMVPYYKIIKEYYTDKVVDNKTIDNFKDEWYRYNIENLKFLKKSRTIFPYLGLYKDKPAIIVSAGPSLSKNINILKEQRDAVIISGGRTLKSLLNIGVDPDFLTILDAGVKSYELVDDYIENTNATLLYDFNIPTDIVRRHKGSKITFYRDNSLQKYLDEPVINLSGGGSVAHAMTNLAIALGCNPIIFIGQDLAFTDQKEHSEVAGSPWKNNDVNLTEENSGYIYVEDVYGKTTKTSISLNLYRKQLERIIEENKHVEFINASEGGAMINGAKFDKLENIYREFKKNKIKLNISECNVCLVDILEELRMNEDIIMKVIKLYEKGIVINKKYIAAINNNLKTNSIERELLQIEKEIRINSNKILFINNITHSIVKEMGACSEFLILKDDSHKKALVKNLNKSLFIFKSMRKKLMENLKIIESEINILLEEKYE